MTPDMLEMDCKVSTMNVRMSVLNVGLDTPHSLATHSPPTYATPAAIWCYDGWADTDLIFNLLIADHMRTGNGGGGETAVVGAAVWQTKTM